jgi:gas vesicle protein
MAQHNAKPFAHSAKIARKLEAVMTRHSGLGSMMLFLGGAGLGVAAGILLAPKAGKRLRSDIAEGLNSGAEEISVSGKKLNQRLGKVVAQAQDHLREAIEAGENAYDVAKNS